VTLFSSLSFFLALAFFDLSSFIASNARFEVPNALTESFGQIRNAAGPEQYDHDDQDY
jgi:hypothetical protein